LQCAQEEKFLEELWKKEGFKVEIWEYDFEKIKKLYPSKSFEELAREKRYQFFDALLHIYKINKILIAHHLDDKIETFFFNMLRGTKLTGLINMTMQSPWILRPLLWIEKKDIYKYLDNNHLKYFEDESNKNSQYTRNYLRNDVLPLLSQVHPEHKKNLKNLFVYFDELKSHLEWEIEKFLWDNTYFALSDFFKLSPLIQKEIIRKIYYDANSASTIWLSESNIKEVLRFMHWKNNKTHKEIRNMHLLKDGDKICII
jgi:tRNA(Ile)-lysidine synthase